MQFSGKALYNLLRINWLKDKSLTVKPWQIEDYRALSTDTLFDKLKKFDINLNKDSLFSYSENCESPEELIECLWIKDESDIESQDQAYLLIFELWRRLVPDKISLSIFCDQLDFCIERYHADIPTADDEVQEILHQLEDILDENVDLGIDPQEVFSSIQENSAHDIESFLYDYIVTQIENNNELYASELLDGFYDYIDDNRWFDFLRARLFAASDPEGGNLMLAGLLEQLEEDPDFDLLFEIASYLTTAADHELFVQTITHAIPLIQTEEDFQDLLDLVAKYFLCPNQDKKAEDIQKFLISRPSSETRFNAEDAKFLRSFLQDAQRREV